MNYQHGGDIYTASEKYNGEIIDFSANINPLGMPEAVIQAACRAVAKAEHYPDPACRRLRQAIAKAEGVLPRQIICGNGAADLIYRLVLACRPRKALLLAPTFSEYEQALMTVGAEIVFHYLKEENEFGLTEDIMIQMSADLDMIWLCNPNNPTGRLLPGPLLEKILDLCRQKNIRLVVDECFLDLCPQGEEYKLTARINDNPELFLLRAFTKSFAMPGLRLGYGLCSDEVLLEKMQACGQPWSVAIPAQEAGIAALNEQEFLKESVAYISRERKWLLAALEKLGIRCFGSQANYILFRLPRAFDLKERLLKKGILIRSCSNYRGLGADYYRIAVRRHWENEKLIEALAQVLGISGE